MLPVICPKKLMPAVYDLANRGLLPPSFALVGFARRDYSDQDFAKEVHDAVREHSRTEFREDVGPTLAGFRFVAGDFTDDTAFDALAATVTALPTNRARVATLRSTCRFHRACSAGGSATQTFRPRLRRAGGWRQVVVEKPLGTTCRAPRNSTRFSTTCFRGGSIFRIDHFLWARETVQNLLAPCASEYAVRTDLEQQLHRSCPDHHGRDIGIGSRAGYYDGIGAARDVIQNHLLQPRRSPPWRNQCLSGHSTFGWRRRRCSPLSYSPTISMHAPRNNTALAGRAG